MVMQKNTAIVPIIVLLALLFVAGCASENPAAMAGSPQTSFGLNTQVFFCHQDHCADKLIGKINMAKTSIDIAIYSFTLDEIADALIEAKNRGVKVRVLFDASQAAGKYSEDERLQENGIEIKRAEKASGIMHDKIAIFDSQTVATGSFNYSNNADKFNDENLVFLENEEIASKYSQEFSLLWNEFQ